MTSYNEVRANPIFQTEGDDGQPKRVAAHFALVAFAGWLATKLGITGWDDGTALEAAGILFKRWKDEKGQGNKEGKDVMNAIADFIDKHGNSRFLCTSGDPQSPVRDLDGYYRLMDKDPACPSGRNDRAYLFTSGGLREALKGLDFKRALKFLAEREIIETGKDGKKSMPTNIRGRTIRLYIVRTKN